MESGRASEHPSDGVQRRVSVAFGLTVCVSRRMACRAVTGGICTLRVTGSKHPESRTSRGRNRLSR